MPATPEALARKASAVVSRARLLKTGDEQWLKRRSDRLILKTAARSRRPPPWPIMPAPPSSTTGAPTR